MALNKKYSVAAATLPYVLLCYAFFILSPQIIGGETFVLIPTAMLFLGSALYAAGLYFYLKADKKIFLHASAAYSAAGALVPSILFMMWADMTEGVCFMVCVLLAAAFYVLGALTLKSASSDGRPFGLLPVSVFSFLLAGTDWLGYYNFGSWSVPEIFVAVQWNISWFTFAAVIVGMGYYYLCCRGKSGKNLALIALAVCGVLTVCSVCLTYMLGGWYLADIYFMIGVLLAYLTLFVVCLLAVIRLIPQGAAKTAMTATPTKAPLEALSDLNKLRQAGILTEEEYQEQKNKILGDK